MKRALRSCIQRMAWKKRSDQNRNNERDEMDKRYLNCSFAQKDQVKALGAKWDAQARSWYVPLGMALEPFAPWLGKSSKGLTGEGLEKEKRIKIKIVPPMLALAPSWTLASHIWSSH